MNLVNVMEVRTGECNKITGALMLYGVMYSVEPIPKEDKDDPEMKRINIYGDSHTRDIVDYAIDMINKRHFRTDVDLDKFYTILN